MEYSPIKKIVIPSKTRARSALTRRETRKMHLDDHVEIKFEYLRHLHNCWIKYFNIDRNEYESGGFVANVGDYAVFLRSPVQKDLVEVYSKDVIFYIKKDDKNYRSLQELLIDKQKTKELEMTLLEQKRVLDNKEKLLAAKEASLFAQKNDIEKLKNRLSKLALDGKIKIYD